MINTVFYFVEDPTFDYETAVQNGDISEYTIVFNSADHSIRAKNCMFGKMSREDLLISLGSLAGIIPPATDSVIGGFKTGYVSDTDQSGRKYAVKLDANNKAYVEVPWTDTITPAFDDSELIRLINEQRQRIDQYITQQTQLISERTLTLFNDTLWVTNNLQQGEFGHWVKESEIEYMRQYGVWDYEYDPSTVVYSAWIYNNDGSTLLCTGKVILTGETLSGLNQIKITECTDSTLVNTTYYMVSSFAADADPDDSTAGSLYYLYDNTLALIGKTIKLKFYSGTPLTDPVTGEPLITIKTSVVQQQADKIYQRVGLVVGDINDINTWQGNIDDWKNNTAAEKSYVTTAISNLEQLVGIDAQTGAISSVTNLSSQVADVDALTKAVQTAVLASLDLKAQKNSDGTFEAVTDLAAFYEDHDGYSLYSGLNNRVSTAEDTITSQGSLITKAQKTADDAQSDLDAYKQTIATAGFATTAWVQDNTDASGAADTAETNAKGYADTKVAGASADMFAAIDEVCAGVGVTLTKHVSDGTDNHAEGEVWYDSSVSIDADNINLNGQTWAQYIGVGTIVADTLSAGTATIDAATIDAATITGTLSGVDGTFTGELSAATGSFTGAVTATSGSFKGNVNAEQFIAGDEEGLNITVTGDSVSFNYGSDQRAWFTTKKSDGTQSDGMFLYIKNPDQTATNKLITIDFTNLKFENVGGSSQRAIQQTDIYSTMTGSNVQAASNIFKGEFDDLYYNDSTLGSSNLITSTSYHQYIKTGYVVIQHNSKYRLYQAKIYDKVSFSSGVKTNDNQFFAVLYDIAGNVLNGTRMSGASSQTTISDPDNTVILGSGSDSNTVGHGGSLWFNKTNNEISPRVGQAGSGGGVISLYKMQSVGSQGTAIVYDRNVTLYS